MLTKGKGIIMGQAPVPIHEKFSDEQKNQVRIWFEEGKTQKQIGELLGVPRRTIGKLFAHLGLSRDHKEAQKSRFDPEFVEKVRELREQGKSIPDIARITARSWSAVGRVIKKYEIDKGQVAVDRRAICEEYERGDNMHKIANKHKISTYVVKKVLLDSEVRLRKPRVSGGGRRKEIFEIDLPPYEETPEWYEKAYKRYGITSIANFIERSPGYVSHKLRKFGIGLVTISERNQKLDYDQILESYKSLGSMSKVATRFNCTIEAVKQILLKNNVVPTPTSEMFAGVGNPFYGQKHEEETRRRCAEIGAVFGKRFWAEHPEYVEVVRKKQKEIWSDLEKRKQNSLIVAKLRKEGKLNPKRGRIWTRFGELIHDSSYELKLIEFCVEDKRVVHLERDFDLIKYEYNGEHYFVPDFRLWLSNGEFLIVETKSEWFARKPKERQKIMSGFSRYRDRFMVLEDDFGELDRRIGLALEPLDFSFDDVELNQIVDVDEYLDFYAVYHYMGRTGRRGWTVGAYLGDLLIGAVTISSITRAEIAGRHDLAQSEVRELVRFCIHPDYQKKNFASWLLSRAVTKYKQDNNDVRMLISFADTTQKHVGTIYKASNWIEDGMTGSSYHYVRDGNIIHKKTVYDRARTAGITERQYAEREGLSRRKELPKARFFLNLM